MQFSFHENCANDSFSIDNETYKYLIKARRHKVGDEIVFRNFEDNYSYTHKLIEINRKDASLQLIKKEEYLNEHPQSLHLIWCMVDPKTVEKYITSLNELGVKKITFVYCEYSQKNFKINLDKLKKILANSSSQCGRTSIIQLDIKNSLNEILEELDSVHFLDFSNTLLEDKKAEVKNLVIGCEGGFSELERTEFIKDKALGFSSPLILRSETAIIAASSKILL